jgi:hypothetical protein
MTATTTPDLSPTAYAAPDAAHARALHARTLDLLELLEQAVTDLVATTWGPDDSGACPAPDGTSSDLQSTLDKIRREAGSICEPAKDLWDPGADVQRTAAWRA